MKNITTAEVLAFLKAEIPGLPDNTSVDLVAQHYINSLSLIEMIGKAEEHFGVEFSMSDFDMEKLSSVDAFTNTINRLLESK